MNLNRRALNDWSPTPNFHKIGQAEKPCLKDTIIANSYIADHTDV